MYLSYITWRTYSEIAYSPWNNYTVFLWHDFSRYAEEKKRFKILSEGDQSRGIFGRSLSGDRPLFWALSLENRLKWDPCVLILNEKPFRFHVWNELARIGEISPWAVGETSVKWDENLQYERKFAELVQFTGTDVLHGVFWLAKNALAPVLSSAISREVMKPWRVRPNQNK